MRILSVAVILFIQFHCLTSSANIFDTVCNNLKVVDARVKKEDITFVGKGICDKNIIIPKDPIDFRLQRVFDKVVVGNKSAEDELVLVLHHINAQNRSGESDGGIGTFSFSADFFRGHSGQYQFIGGVDSFYEIYSPKHVKDSLFAVANRKLSSILVHYAKVNLRMETEKNYSLDQLSNKRRDEKMSYPTYNTDQIKKGIFFTCDQFLMNTPVDTPFVKWTSAIGDDNITHFFYLNAKGKREEQLAEKSFFAIFDGEELWIADTISAERAKYEDGDWYVNKHYKHFYVPGNYMMMPSLGAIGGAIVGAAAGAAQNSSKTVWGTYKTRFDPVRQRFVPVKWIK